MKTDREEHAFRAAYHQLVDPAPPAPSWEELMDTATQKKESPADRAPTSRRPILIAAASALLVALFIGGFALFGPLGGTEDVELIDEPPVTTTVATETTVATSEPAPSTTLPAVPLEWETVVGPPMRFPTVALSAEGYPMIVGRYDIDAETGLGTIGLVRCLDPDCVQEPEVIDLVEGVPHQSYGLTIVTGSDGFPVVPFNNGHDPTQTYVDPFTGSEWMALPFNEVIYCRDAACSATDRYELGSETALGTLASEGWMFGPDGLPMFTYTKGEPDDRALHLVLCADPGCEGIAADEVVDAAPAVQGNPVNQEEPVAAPEVRLFYTVETPTGGPGAGGGWDEATYYKEVRVATCADNLCTGGPTIRTIGPGWMVRSFEGPDGMPRIVVRTAAYWPWEADLDPTLAQLSHELVTCFDPSCDRVERQSLGTIDLTGPMTGMGGWNFGPDGAPIGVSTVEILEEAMVPGEYGLEPGYVTVGKRLVYSRCDDPGCSSWSTTELERWTEDEDPDGWYMWGELAGVHVKPDGLPQVFFDGPGGVHLLHCPDLACTPPS
jgi:hypothetical protein